MTPNKAKPEISEKDQKWAYKSWQPFLFMVIAGAMIFTIGIVLYIVGIANAGASQTNIAIGLLVGCIICWIVSAGLLGPGIPLMIVTIIKRNKARAKLGLEK